MANRAVYLCGACGEVASTVTLVAPGQPDPRSIPTESSRAEGAAQRVGPVSGVGGRLAVDGGPVSLTHGLVPLDRVAVALGTGDAAELFALNREYAPFWCPTCRASYCSSHYRSWPVFDDGFFDCMRGVCPKGHERRLAD